MPEPAAPAAAPEELANDPQGEGTTPEEVASVLKSSGMNLPGSEAPPVVDDEEGDEPEEPVAAPPAEEEEAEEEPVEEPVEEPAKPVPAVADETADDKYSFEITDANDVTFKISADAKMEDILAEFEPKNNGQILDILEQLREVKGQKAVDDAKAETDKATEERQARASELLQGWDEEAKALQGNKRIAEGDDGSKRISAVYKFMADENDKRIKDGKPTLNSFEDALDKLENKEARDKAVADAKAEKEEARRKGGLVGGASAPASSGQPVYKAGTAKNANEAIRSLGLL